MSDQSESKQETPDPHEPQQLGEAGEHPLSILLFSWMRSELFFRLFMAALAGAGVLLVAIDIVSARPAYVSLHTIPGFFGIFGFLAFALAVLSGWPLGKLMRRPEDYYDTSSGEAGRDD